MNLLAETRKAFCWAPTRVGRRARVYQTLNCEIFRANVPPEGDCARGVQESNVLMALGKPLNEKQVPRFVANVSTEQ